MIKAKISNDSHSTEMTFPCKEKQLAEKLGQIGIGGEQLFPTGTIEHIEPTELSVLENRTVSLDALNFLAKRLDGMDSKEQNQFFAVLNCGELKEDWSLKKAINLTFNLPRYTLINDTENLAHVGLTHMLNIRGGIPASEFENKEWLAEEGRKLLDSGKGIQTEYGLLFVNEEIMFDEVFDGGVFPAYLYNCDTAVTVLVGCGKSTELLELPTEDIAIKKSLARLGADSVKDCTIEFEVFKEVSDDLSDKIHSFESSADIFGLNNFLKSDKLIKELKSEDSRMEKFSSLFNREVSRMLCQNGFTVSESSNGIAVSLSDDIQAKIYPNGMISAPKSDPNEAYYEIKNIARTVSEYCAIYERATMSEMSGLPENYRCLAEFNGTVLAAKYNEKYGFEFVTWSRNFEDNTVYHGKYFDDYISAKEDFAARSGLVDSQKMFSEQELRQLDYCVNFTLENDKNMCFSCQDDIENLKEKIGEMSPELQANTSPDIVM